MDLLRGLFYASGCLFLTGCAKPPPVAYYSEPSRGTDTATITGETTDPGFSKSINDLHSYALGVDGDSIAHPDDPYNRTIVVAAGQRFVTLGCKLGGTYASSSSPAEIKAGQSYTAKCECGNYKAFDQPWAYVWLQDSAGHAVTEKKVASLEAGGSAPIIIPIFHR